MSHAECMDNGYCKEKSWCPNIDSAHTKAESLEILGLENLKASIWTGIDFEGFGSDSFAGHDKSNKVVEFPDSNANSFSVMEIIKEAGISNVEDIHSTGAIIRMTFDWYCDLEEDDCKPSYIVERLDGESEELPYLMNRVYHYKADGVDTRDYYRYIGIKMMLVARGKAREFALHVTMLQIASLLALLKLCKDITDFIMLTCTSATRKKIYTALKIEESVDFSDKMEGIDVLKYQREMRRKEKDA